ncbi:hypothetical protein ACVTNV_002336 [Vibrio alginolyticus]|nr:hypothetical protein [Vibrio parahaemolyticus O1]
MAATKQDCEDFQFIISESIRLQRLLNESYDLYAKDFDDVYGPLFSTIDIPKDVYEQDKSQQRFQIHLSSKAQIKLLDITKRQIKQNNWLYELTVDEYIDDIKDSIYIHINNDKKFDFSGCSSLLSRAYKRALSKMREVRYLFPLNAASIRPEKDINIGCVKITHKDNVNPKINDVQGKKALMDRNAQSEYNSFLCIDIPKCSNKSSHKRALNVADFIYGVIKVFSFYYQVNTKQLVLNKNPTEASSSHYVTCENDNYYVCGSYSFGNDLSDFWDEFEADLNSEYSVGEIVFQLIDYAISPVNQDCLSDRLIDSFCWFGDASRDNNEHSQVVKLATAMERLVTLSIEKKDPELTKRFYSRVSCSIAVFEGEIDRWKIDAKKLYELRSNLVHGTQTLHKSHEISLDFSPFRLACLLILSSCIGFSTIGLDTLNYEYKLQEMYDQLSKHCLNQRYKEKLVR